MPRFRFKGFPSGVAVALSASQGGAPAEAGVPAWGGGGTASARVEISRKGLNCVGEAIRFEAVDVTGLSVTDGPYDRYDPLDHEIEWFWTITAPTGEPSEWTAVNRLAPLHNDRLSAYGRYGFVVPRSAGTWRFDVWGVDANGDTVEAAATVDVAPWGDVAADADTWLLHDGDLTGAPVHDAARRYATWDGMVAALKSVTAGGHIRVQIKGGATFSQTSVLALADIDCTSLILHTYGSGRATVTHVPGGGDFYEDNWFNDQNVILCGLDIVGPWDSTVEGPDDTTVRIAVDMITNGEERGPERGLNIFDCTFSGWGNTFYCDNQMVHMYLEDVVITNHLELALFSNGVWYLRGCNFDDHPLALCGGRRNDASTADGAQRNAHAITRGGGIRVIDACQMFCHNGWSWWDSGGWPAAQPNVRFDVDPSSAPTAKCNIQRSVFEGHGIAIGSTSDTAIGPTNILIERNIILGIHQPPKVETALSGVTIRNNVIIGASASRSAVASVRPRIVLDSRLVHAASGNNDPVRLVNNTIVDLLPADGAFVGLTVAEAFPDQAVANTLEYAPNYATPHQPDGTLVAEPGTTPICGGARMGFTHHRFTLVSDLAPGTSSAEIPWFDDYDGVAVDDTTFAGGAGKHNLFGGSYSGRSSSYWTTAEGLSFSLSPTGVTLSLASDAGYTILSGDYRLQLDRRHNLSGPIPGSATPAADGQLWAPAAPAVPDAPLAVPHFDFFGRVRSAVEPTKGAIDPNAT